MPTPSLFQHNLQSIKDAIELLEEHPGQGPEHTHWTLDLIHSRISAALEVLKRYDIYWVEKPTPSADIIPFTGAERAIPGASN